MVADRAGTSGSCQALRMMMRVASPIDRRIGEGGGQMRHSGFERADFHSFGLFLPVNWSRKRAGSEYARRFPRFKRRKRSETLARAGASGSPVRCVGVARQFIVIWFDHTQPSPLLPMASTGHPSMASLQSASSSGLVGCLNTWE